MTSIRFWFLINFNALKIGGGASFEVRYTLTPEQKVKKLDIIDTYPWLDWQSQWKSYVISSTAVALTLDENLCVTYFKRSWHGLSSSLPTFTFSTNSSDCCDLDLGWKCKSLTSIKRSWHRLPFCQVWWFYLCSFREAVYFHALNHFYQSL